MNLPENATPYLAQTLTRLLGKAMPGSMAFIRCLPTEVVRALAADGRFVVVNWQITAVTASIDAANRNITADVAVEWREDKAEATLLLVDTESAGAGMDGIYSAAREIGELELFDAAQLTVRVVKGLLRRHWPKLGVWRATKHFRLGASLRTFVVPVKACRTWEVLCLKLVCGQSLSMTNLMTMILIKRHV